MFGFAMFGRGGYVSEKWRPVIKARRGPRGSSDAHEHDHDRLARRSGVLARRDVNCRQVSLWLGAVCRPWLHSKGLRAATAAGLDESIPVNAMIK